MNIDEMDFSGLDSELGNGWVIGLISTLTPGIVRIQLMSPGEFEPGWRKCVEAKTFDKALEKAIEFTHGITWLEYGKKILEESDQIDWRGNPNGKKDSIQPID